MIDVTHLGLKYSRLTKFIQKIDPNSRMPRIFMDSVDKLTFYIYVISRNKLAWLDKSYTNIFIIQGPPYVVGQVWALFSAI